jgi:hypothetical protein
VKSTLSILTALLLAQLVAAHAADSGVFNVRDFGAVADGTTDDTAAVQRAIDAARAGGTVLFPPGTYRITSVMIRPGIRYLGYGATIERPPRQSKWTRTFATHSKEGQAWSSEEDSPVLTLEGLTFDGNLAEQQDYTRYQLEQAHLVFLSADAKKRGRLRARVLNCTFRNGVADGLSLHVNVEAQISNCTAVDCFRGGLVITGGNSRVQVNNFIARGRRHATGIDVEVDGAGCGGSYALELTMDGISLPDGDFDVGVKGASVVLGSHIVARSPFNVYGGGESRLVFSDSVFGVGAFSGYGNRIVLPGDVTFRNCRFTVENAGEAKTNKWAAVHLYLNISGTSRRVQSVRLIDCELATDPAIPESDTTYGVFVEADKPQNENRLELRGCHIGPGFDHGVFLRQGGRATIHDTRIEADSALHFGSTAQYPLDVCIRGLETTGRECAHFAWPVRGDRFFHDHTFVNAQRNVLSAPKGLGSAQYLGGRIIVGEAPPNPATHGLINDRYRLRTPVQGAAWEWICMKGGTGAGAVWQPLAPVPPRAPVGGGEQELPKDKHTHTPNRN